MSKNGTIDLWFIDEVHFQQYGSACRMWVPPEIANPVLLHQPTRKSIGYFGAVRVKDGKFVYQREENKFNGESFFSFLKRLRRSSCRSSRKVVVVADNARYHHAVMHKEWREQNRRQFALEFLPPYSPELNPIERVWKLTRRRATHNRYFSTLQELTLSIEKVFNTWGNGNNILNKTCAII